MRCLAYQPILAGVSRYNLAPSCALDAEGARLQADRYRHIGRGARLIASSARRTEVLLRPDVDVDLVSELVAVERACCPFFSISWDGRRQLGVSVSKPEDEPALAAVTFALGLADEQ